ncbi:MAG TPA: outer membrane beta-barrel protein, partial [Flavipsychrobacter sp.]|nr:outer membrane beta-barrel protein [Flavipsychrobacter sp.]
MKIKVLIVLLLFSTTSLFAQEQGVGVHFGAYDFYGPQTSSYFFTSKQHITYGADNAKNDTGKRSVLLWHPLVRVTYWFQLNRWFDLNLGLSLANLQYPTKSPDSVYINREFYDLGDRKDRFLGELDARINFNIIERDKHKFSPYIFAGITGSYHNVFFGADFPAGIGLNIRMDKNIYLNLETGYKVALTNNDQNHLQHTIGIVYWFRPGYRAPATATSEEEAPEIPVAIADMDHDGVP